MEEPVVNSAHSVKHSDIGFHKIHFSIDNGILVAILTAILDTEYANIIFVTV